MSITKGLPVKPFTETRGRGFFMIRRGTTALVCCTEGSPAEKKAREGHILFDRLAQERKHCSHIMFNAGDAPRAPKGKCHEYRIATGKEFTILQDSGGYQLVSGAKKFVDPISVATAHNTYAREGVGLDIPTGSLSNLKLIVDSAKIQNLNNAIIRKNLNKNVQLFATSQGVTPQGRKQYLDVMLDSDFDGITIAGLRPILGVYAPTPVQLMLHLLYVVYRTRKRTTRYHILGVSTFSTMLMLACAAQHLRLNLTSDSARHILCGAGGSTLSNPNLMQISSSAGTRRKGGSVGDRGGYNSGCSCRICNALPLNHAYSESRFLQTHAFNSITSAATHAREEAAVALLDDNYSVHGANFAKALRLLKTVTSAKEAFELLTREIAEAKARPSLFARSGAGDTVLSTNELEKQMRAVIERYQQYHKTGKIDPSWIKEK